MQWKSSSLDDVRNIRHGLYLGTNAANAPTSGQVYYVCFKMNSNNDYLVLAYALSGSDKGTLYCTYLDLTTSVMSWYKYIGTAV